MSAVDVLVEATDLKMSEFRESSVQSCRFVSSFIGEEFWTRGGRDDLPTCRCTET